VLHRGGCARQDRRWAAGLVPRAASTGRPRSPHIGSSLAIVPTNTNPGRSQADRTRSASPGGSDSQMLKQSRWLLSSGTGSSTRAKRRSCTAMVATASASPPSMTPDSSSGRRKQSALVSGYRTVSWTAPVCTSYIPPTTGMAAGR